MGSGVSRSSKNTRMSSSSQPESITQSNYENVSQIPNEIFLMFNKIDSIKLILANHVGCKFLLEYLISVNKEEIYYLYVELSIIIVIISQHALNILLSELCRFYENYFLQSSNEDNLIVKNIDWQLHLKISCFANLFAGLNSHTFTDQDDIEVRRIYLELRQVTIHAMGNEIVIPFLKSSYYSKWVDYTRQDLYISKEYNKLDMQGKINLLNDKSVDDILYPSYLNPDPKLTDLLEQPSYLRRNKYYMKSLYMTYKRKKKSVYKYIGVDNWLAELIYMAESIPIGFIIFSNQTYGKEVCDGIYLPSVIGLDPPDRDKSNPSTDISYGSHSFASNDYSNSDAASVRSQSCHFTNQIDFPFNYPKLKSREYSLEARTNPNIPYYPVYYINKYLEYNIGFSLNELLDNSCNFLDFISYRQDITNLSKALQQKVQHTSNYNNCRVDGTILNYVVSCKYLGNNMYISLVRDVTKDSDFGLESMDLIEKFISCVPNFTTK